MSPHDSINAGAVGNDVFGLVANVVSDHILRTGAKVWINYCNGDAAHPKVYGLNRSGRAVEKYTHFKRLTNFRAVWMPEHLRSRLASQWATKEEAASQAAMLAAMWVGVRYYNRDGTQLLRDGVKEREAFERMRRGFNAPNENNQ